MAICTRHCAVCSGMRTGLHSKNSRSDHPIPPPVTTSRRGSTLARAVSGRRSTASSHGRAADCPRWALDSRQGLPAASLRRIAASRSMICSCTSSDGLHGLLPHRLDRPSRRPRSDLVTRMGRTCRPPKTSRLLRTLARARHRIRKVPWPGRLPRCQRSCQTRDLQQMTGSPWQAAVLHRTRCRTR